MHTMTPVWQIPMHYASPATLAEAVHRAQSVLGLPAPQRAARLPLATPVRLCNGADGVISGHSTADCHSYRISWFDRHLWTVRHKWTDRKNFAVIEGAVQA